MHGPQFKYLMLILCSVFLGVAALLGYLARSYDMPLSILLLSALFAAFAVMLPGFWSWRQRQRLDRAVRGLIGAAEYSSTLTEGIFVPPFTGTTAVFSALTSPTVAAAENVYARGWQGSAAPKQVSRTTNAPSVEDSLGTANVDRPSTNEI